MILSSEVGTGVLARFVDGPARCHAVRPKSVEADDANLGRKPPWSYREMAAALERTVAAMAAPWAAEGWPDRHRGTFIASLLIRPRRFQRSRPGGATCWRF